MALNVIQAEKRPAGGGSVAAAWRQRGGSMEAARRQEGGSEEAAWRQRGGSVEAAVRGSVVKGRQEEADAFIHVRTLNQAQCQNLSEPQPEI
ncbi:hypothetical protein EYF80_028382 [Liparis tanakae]|uniref:Uncharacterized protein n=1 Tax=Liparis tanakae TaxID=230148 RepID=A0A4Z2H7Z9_9TELE|nr:hypothetical protein EYF80_028382 [Liparis tanakae]